MRRQHKFPKSILLFVTLYMVAALASAISLGNMEFIAYVVVVLLIMGVVYGTHLKVGFSRPVLWGLAIWGLLHMAGGLVNLPEGWSYHGEQNVLYSWWLIDDTLKYDHLVHAFGFGLTTVLCWEALSAGIQHRLGRKLYPSFGLIVLCMAGGMGFGALNEVVEFFATLYIENTNVGGYRNTGWDLVSNLVGCMIGGLVILFRG